MTSKPRHLHAVPASPRRPYPAEFRAVSIARVAAGEPISHVARDLDISRNTLKTWVRIAATKSDTGQPPASTSPSGIVEAAASGERRPVLVALRTELAAKIDAGLPSRDLPVYARLLDQTILDIAALDAQDETQNDATVDDEDLDPEDL